MNFLKKISDFIFGRKVTIQDDFFGEMVDRGTYFECRKVFRPIGKELGVTIDKVGEKIILKQQEFFNKLEQDYAQFEKKLKTVLEKEINEAILNYKIKDFKKEFSLVHLSIPQCEKEEEWIICFYENRTFHHNFTLTIKEDEVINILMDG